MSLGGIFVGGKYTQSNTTVNVYACSNLKMTYFYPRTKGYYLSGQGYIADNSDDMTIVAGLTLAFWSNEDEST